MNQFLLYVVILVMIPAGCSRDVPPPDDVMNVSSMLELTDPEAIAQWEASADNISHSKIEVVELSYLYDTLGNTEQKSPRAVAVEICEARQNGITPEQQQALDFFVTNEKEIHTTVRKAIYQQYQESYPDYKEAYQQAAELYGGPNNIEEELPPIISGTELDQLIDFAAIRINPAKDGKATIGITAFGEWDINGIGIRLLDGKVIEIGNAYVGL
ncbi:DUF6985 domain-containing protein [Gimesia alba]|nr:hypothetical protein [Gimesia alba]